jgi:hypothetical protein
MSELTDLQLCKRIAEIEGVGFGTYESTNQSGKKCELYFYNPLTDDALCFQLLKKYDIDLIAPYRPNGDVLWEAQIFIDDCADALSEYGSNPNKAILLAIIEANT